MKNNTILGQLRVVLESARGIVSSQSKDSILEWSVGDLGKQIANNITDKVSLKSIKKGDTLVIAKTSVSKLAQKQDKDGDVQLTVESISGSSVTCKAGSESIELDMLDMRILEAYSMDKSDVKIFVIDLPTKVDNKLFGEELNVEQKQHWHDALVDATGDMFDVYVKEINKFLDKIDQENYGKTNGEIESGFKKSKLVVEIKDYMGEFIRKSIDKVTPKLFSHLKGRDLATFNASIDDPMIDIKNSQDYYDLDAGLHSLISGLKTIKGLMNTKFKESLDSKKKD